MRRKHLSVVTAVLALVVGLVAAPPLSAKPKAMSEVTGTVTFRGKLADKVLVAATHDGKRYTGWTDEEGRFSLEVPVGNYKIHAYSKTKSAHSTWAGGALREPDAKEYKVRKGKATEVKIDLARAITVKGQVLDRQGEPAVNVKVWARNLDREGEATARTDGEGRYVLKRLSPGEIEVYRSWYDMKPVEAGRVVVNVKKRKTVTAPDMQMKRMKRGTITAEIEGGEDLKFDVIAYDPKDRKRFFRLKFDAESGVWAAKVPTGTWRVAAAGTQTASKNAKVKKRKTTHVGTLAIPVERSKLVVEVVRTNGKPAKYGYVSLVDSFGQSRTGARIKKNGRATVRNLVPGTYTVHLDNTHYTWGEHPSPAQVKVKGAKTKQTVRLEKGHTVRGTVRHQGKGVRKIPVRLTSLTDPNVVIWRKTNAKGNFTFPKIVKGSYVIDAIDDSPVYRMVQKKVTVRGNVTGVRIDVKK